MDTGIESDLKPDLEGGKAICRCCLSTEKRLTKIDHYRGLFIDLADIIVSESDGLPQWLCYECQALLLKAVRFKRRVLRAHTVLYDYHSRCAPIPKKWMSSKIKDATAHSIWPLAV